MSFNLENKKYKAVVLAAGRGVRIGETSEDLPKVLLPIKGKPLLWYVIDYWRKYVDEFVFVVGHQKEMVVDYLNNLDIKQSSVVQCEPKGIADALMRAKNQINDNFILILGDCYCRGIFDFPDEFEQGVGIWQTQNQEMIKKSYSVEIKDNCLSRVVEKPKEIVNDSCGMGFYFFSQRVFDHIGRTPPSSLRNEVEITDVIEKMIEAGEKIMPIYFQGDYINVNYPEDLINLLNKYEGED